MGLFEEMGDRPDVRSLVEQVEPHIHFSDTWGSEEREACLLELVLALCRSHSSPIYKGPCSFLSVWEQIFQVRPLIQVAPSITMMWGDTRIADCYIQVIDSTARGQTLTIIDGALRPEVFNNTNLVCALVLALERGVQVNIVAGPMIMMDDDGNNRTAQLIDLGSPGYQFYLSTERWETMGCFRSDGAGLLAKPRQEVEDFYRFYFFGSGFQVLASVFD